MSEIKVEKRFKTNNNYKVLKIDEITNSKEPFKVSQIILLEGIMTKEHNEDVYLMYNDYDNPIVIMNNNCIFINPTWYSENKELVDNLANYICKYSNSKKLIINQKELINDKLIDDICQNKNIQYLSLATPLTLSYYQKIKESTIKTVNTVGVVEELKDNFDPLIVYNQPKEIEVKCQLTEEEKNELSNINNPKSTIIFDDTSYQNLKEVIEILKNNKASNQIKIKITDKEKFNKYLFDNKIDYNNILIELEDIDVSLTEYLKYEKHLYEMIKDTKNLSTFERYIYAYNVTKNFKEYKENKEDLLASRSLYRVLDNEYMVCVGFTEMFGDLLKKSGIISIDIEADVDSSYDDSLTNEEPVEGIAKPTKKEKHLRRYVYLKDKKYGIDGFYITDPTWDNDLENDYYNHLALTDREITGQSRYNWLMTENHSELFCITSLEEYYEKLNFITTTSDFFNLRYTFKQIIKIIAKLEPEYIEKLKNKYPFIDELKWPKEFTSLINDIGKYLLSHVNKEISGATIMEAVSNVYKNAYGYTIEECQIKMQDIIEKNKQRQEEYFPKRFKISEDGTKEIIMNEKNKFELSNNQPLKSK